MRAEFIGYYPPSDEEIKSLWENGLICFDANTLLDIYSYSAETADVFIKILENYKDRLWLPHQAGYEYHKNRAGRISQEVKKYDDVIGSIEGTIDKLENFRQPFASEETIDSFRSAITELTAQKETHSKYFNEDKYRDKLTEIFHDKVGESFSEDELSEIYESGERRYKENVPPGFEDKDKKHPERYGDLIVWEQLVAKASSDGKDLILVTSDSKKDWWSIHNGKTQGPRPELIEEFHRRTEHKIYIYKRDRFMEYAKHELDVTDEAIEEVRQLQEKELELSTIRKVYYESMRQAAVGVTNIEPLRQAAGMVDTEAARQAVSLSNSEAARQAASLVNSEAVRQATSLVNSEAVRQATSLVNSEATRQALSTVEAARAAGLIPPWKK